MSPSNTIHKQLYDFIHHHPRPLSFTNLKNKFPFLPTSLLTQALQCHKPIPTYHHPPLPTLSPPSIPHNPTPTMHPSQIITWNVASLTTTLPNLQDLINTPSTEPSIIALQETKLTTTKSTYKNYFPNTNYYSTIPTLLPDISIDEEFHLPLLEEASLCSSTEPMPSLATSPNYLL